MSIRSKFRVGVAVVALCAAGCSSAPQSDARSESVGSELNAPSTNPSETTTTTTTTTTAVSEASPTAAPVTTVDNQQQAKWAQKLLAQVEPSGLQPEALAFADSFVDPGLHYQFAPGADWELVGRDEYELAPFSHWRAGDVTVITGSTPVGESTLERFVESEADSVIYIDETHALLRDETAGEVRYQLLILDVERVALIVARSATEVEEQLIDAVLPSMLTFERTPLSEADLGEPSEIEVAYWLGQFDTMEPEIAARYGDPLSAATCIASGLDSDRLTRYSDLLASDFDPSDELQLHDAANFLADQEELLAHCDLPPGSFGSWSPESTYVDDFITEQADQ